MKPIKFLFIVSLASLCLSLTPMPYHKVKYVYDGDTILLESGEKVRYLGINPSFAIQRRMGLILRKFEA